MTKIYFSKEGRLNDVVIIRSVAILMVVAFHAYYMMMVDAHFPASKDMYHDMYFNLNALILQFRMPLFIMISGYLFSHLENDRGKYATFSDLLHNKAKRLLVPFFIFSTVFMLSINNFSMRPYYVWGYEHLWFIPMLFWCFIFTRLQSFLPFSGKKWWKIALFALFFILNLIPPIQIPLFAIPNFLRWYFWFYFGYNLYLNRNYIYGYLTKQKIIYTLMLLSIFGIGVYLKCICFDGNDSLHTWYSEIANVSICILFWYWINYLIIHGIDEKHIKAFNWLNKHSYGIYVFHNWIQPFMISTTAIGLFSLDAFANNHPILFPLTFFISSFIISLGLTWLLLKTKIGKFLIG